MFSSRWASVQGRRSRAVTLWDMGQIARDAGGLSTVGEVYGGMLAESGNSEYGLEVLELARQVYAMLGQPQNAERVKSLIARLGQDVRE